MNPSPQSKLRVGALGRLDLFMSWVCFLLFVTCLTLEILLLFSLILRLSPVSTAPNDLKIEQDKYFRLKTYD